MAFMNQYTVWIKLKGSEHKYDSPRSVSCMAFDKADAKFKVSKQYGSMWKIGKAEQM